MTIPQGKNQESPGYSEGFYINISNLPGVENVLRERGELSSPTWPLQEKQFQFLSSESCPREQRGGESLQLMQLICSGQMLLE